ncbi:hypothetical protein FHG87_019795 [Trinorchestia longiramus]|nr:hypothetical protein FHG87_019795 [Trinorchestia longiramus]
MNVFCTVCCVLCTGYWVLSTFLGTETEEDSLDLVMTTPDLSINGLEVTDKIGDHQMIVFALEVHDPTTKTQRKHVTDYKRADFDLMKEKLSSISYEVLMVNKNTQESYMILKEKIATATEYHIPTKRLRPTNDSPWFS